MKLLSNPLWRLVVDIATLVSGVALLFAAILGSIRFLSQIKTPWIFYLLILALVTASILVSLRFKREFKALRHRVKEQKVIEDVKSEGKKANSLTPSKLVPSARFVKRTFKFIEERALQWARDAQKGTENFYVHVSGPEVDYVFQVYYHSEMKNLTRTFYIGSRYGESDKFEDLVEYRNIIAKGLCNAFPKWRQAVIFCVNATQESLPEDFSMAVQQASNNLTMSISFNYQQNDIDKSHSFEYDGETLTDKSTNRTFQV